MQHHIQQNQQQDALTKFLQQQQNNQMHLQNKQHPNNQMMQQQQQHINNLHQQQPHHPFPMHGEHNQQHSDVHALMRDVANGLLTQHPQVAIVGLELIPKQNITDAIKFVDFESTALNGDAAAAATTSSAATTATSSSAAATAAATSTSTAAAATTTGAAAASSFCW